VSPGLLHELLHRTSTGVDGLQLVQATKSRGRLDTSPHTPAIRGVAFRSYDDGNKACEMARASSRMPRTVAKTSPGVQPRVIEPGYLARR
jgi:hypothetical protein